MHTSRYAVWRMPLCDDLRKISLFVIRCKLILNSYIKYFHSFYYFRKQKWKWRERNCVNMSVVGFSCRNRINLNFSHGANNVCTTTILPQQIHRNMTERKLMSEFVQIQFSYLLFLSPSSTLTFAVLRMHIAVQNTLTYIVLSALSLAVCYGSCEWVQRIYNTITTW